MNKKKIKQLVYSFNNAAVSSTNNEDGDKNNSEELKRPSTMSSASLKQFTEGDDLSTMINSGEEYESDNDIGDENTIGNVPLWKYADQKHIGYNLKGQKILKSLDTSEITKLLNNADNPDNWKTIPDIKNQRLLTLSNTDIEIIRRIQSSSFPVASFDPTGEDSIVDFHNPEEAIHPSNNSHPPKRRFVPSLWENKEINRLVRLIREGKIKPERKLEEDNTLWDVWGNSITSDIFDASRGRAKGPPPLPAPKMSLPGHEESYNPPKEYLFTKEEQSKWESDDPEDRDLNFIPKQFNCLRHVPLYKDGIVERFQRCLDLYLCPRSLKMRMNVDQSSLLPVLPSLRDLKPFPSALSVIYDQRAGDVGPAIMDVCVDSTGTYVAASKSDGTVEIYSLLLSKLICSLSLPSTNNESRNPEKCYSVQFNPVFPIISVAKGDTVFVLVLKLSVFVNQDLEYSQLKSLSGKENECLNQVSPLPSSWDLIAALKALHRLSIETPNTSELTSWTPISDEYLKANSMVIDGWVIKHASEVQQSVWHSKGSYLATVCTNAASPSQQVAIHSLLKLKTVKPFRKAGDGKIQKVYFHPIKPWLFVAYFKSLKYYNLQQNQAASGTKGTTTGSLLRKCVGVDEILDISIHPSGDHVIVGGANRRLTWFDLDLGSKPYRVLRYHKGAVKSVGFHPNGYPLMFSASSDGSIHVFHSKVFTDLSESPSIIPVKKLTPSKLLSTTSSSLSGNSPSDPVTCCCWHPTQPWLVIGTQKGHIGLYV